MQKVGHNTYILDDEELEVYELIKSGEVRTISKHVESRLAVQRLVRNGLIENLGSRTRPKWVLSSKWKAWPFNTVSTIILPDGDNNRDPFLEAHDRRIADAEELLRTLKEIRADYVSRGDSELKALRTYPQWRKHHG